MRSFYVIANAVILSMLCLTCQLSAAPLSAIEQQLSEQIERDQSSALALLEQAVNINSGTLNFAGVRKTGQLFANALQALDFATQWLDGAAFNRSGHLVATRGTLGPRLLLIGHLDTVFTKSSPFQSYTKLTNNRASGPGIIDMKGGDVVMIYALRALHAQNILDRFSIRVVMTGDEEKSGQPLALSKQALIEAAHWADIAIGFEDGDGDAKTAVVSRRGSTRWHLVVTGKAAHSSQIFREDIGYGAIFESARIVDGFRQALAQEPMLTFNPGLMVGGTDTELQAETSRATAFGKSNVIAKTSSVVGDIRALSPQQLSKAQQRMHQITSRSLPHTQATLTFDKGYPPMPRSTANLKLLAMLNQVSQDLGYGAVTAVNPRRAGAADISFVADHVPGGAIDGLGLMGEAGHTEAETADLNSLSQQIKKAALLIYRIGLNNELRAG